MKLSTRSIFLLIMCLTFLLSGCASALALVPKPTATSQAILTFPLNNGMQVKVTGSSSLPQANFLIAWDGTNFKTETRFPSGGNTYFVATLHFMLPGSTSQTTTLNFPDILIVDTTGKSWPAKAITYQGDYQNPTHLAFFSGIGQDGTTGLDFGLGFTGNEMTSSMRWPEGYLDQVHLDSSADLTFLFEIPQASQLHTINLWSLPAISLNPSNGGNASQKVQIVSVQRDSSLGNSQTVKANNRPGYDYVLIGLKTDQKISPFGGDLVLKDNSGNSYPMTGLYNGEYIFEVPQTVVNLTLVVKNTIEIPLAT